MTRIPSLAPRFIEDIPEPIDRGILYISLEHRSMIHLCACGCGNEVALPLSALDWRLTYDGATVSVRPSVGSWSLPCRSHYIIDRGRIRWATDWSDEQIKAGRQSDRLRRQARHNAGAPTTSPPTIAVNMDRDAAGPTKRGMLDGLRHWLARLRGRA